MTEIAHDLTEAPPAPIPVERFDNARGIYLPGPNTGVVSNIRNTNNPQFKPEFHNHVPPMVGAVVEPVPTPTPLEAPAPLENPELTTLQQQVEQLAEQLQNQNQEIGQLREQLQNLVDQIQQLAGNIDQLTQQLAQQNNNFQQQNANIIQILNNLVTNQNQQPPAPGPAPAPAPAPVPAPAPGPAPGPAPAPAPAPPPGPPPAPPPAPAPPPGPPEPEPEPPEPEEVETEIAQLLAAARDDLARLRIRVTARSFDWPGRGGRDREAYEAAKDAHMQRLIAYLQERRGQLEADGIDVIEIRRQLAEEYYDEFDTLIDREVALNQELNATAQAREGWRGRWSRLVNRWANMSTRRKLLIGIGIGAGVALASGTMGAGLAAVAAGSALRFSQGILNRSASARNVSQRSAAREHEWIARERARSVLHLEGPADTDEYITGLADTWDEDLLEKKDKQRRRRQRAGLAVMLAGTGMAAYGVAELLGAPRLIPGIIDSIRGGDGDGPGVSPNEPPGPWNPDDGGNGFEGLYYHGQGHEAAVRLPEGLHLGKVNGMDTILDSQNNVVFSDQADGIWNEQGRLTTEAIRHFKNLGHKVTEGKNFYDPGSDKWHFYTEIS